MFCTNCGTHLDDDKEYQFCTSCGKPLAKGKKAAPLVNTPPIIEPPKPPPPPPIAPPQFVPPPPPPPRPIEPPKPVPPPPVQPPRPVIPPTPPPPRPIEPPKPVPPPPVQPPKPVIPPPAPPKPIPPVEEKKPVPPVEKPKPQPLAQPPIKKVEPPIVKKVEPEYDDDEDEEEDWLETSRKKRKKRIIILLIFLLLLGGGVGVYFAFFAKVKGPDAMVKAYMEAIGNYDLNAIKSLSTTETQKDIDLLRLLPTSHTQNKRALSGDVTCPETIAGQGVMCSSCCEAQNAKARFYNTKNVNGSWKIDFDLAHFDHTPEGACLAILAKMRDHKFPEAKLLMTDDFAQTLENSPLEQEALEPHAIDKISCTTNGGQTTCTWCCGHGTEPENKLILIQENGVYRAAAVEQKVVPPPIDTPPAPPKLEVFDGAPYIQSGDAKVANKDWQGASNDYMTVKTHKKNKKYDCKNCDLSGKSNPFRETGQKLIKNEATKTKGETLVKMADDLDR